MSLWDPIFLSQVSLAIAPGILEDSLDANAHLEATGEMDWMESGSRILECLAESKESVGCVCLEQHNRKEDGVWAVWPADIGHAEVVAPKSLWPIGKKAS